AYRLRGAEAGPRDHPEQGVVGEHLTIGCGDRVFPTRLGHNYGAVDTASVVAHPEHHAVPLPRGGQEDPTLDRLPRRRADFGPLDSVIGRVPDQVQQRITDLVQDGAVELDFLAFQVEPDPLAEVAGQVP